MPRGPDGQIVGSQCLNGALDLYSVAGPIRNQLIQLQRELREQYAKHKGK